MLLPAFQDLIKPQWRTVLEALKTRGELPVSELARLNGVSYMAAKSHCEALTKAGYLVRSRLPRTEVGRPEILYSLSDKASSLFVQAGMEFTLDLLENTRRIFGESTPDKLLFQYFQKLQQSWAHELEGVDGPTGRAAKLAKLRCKAGYASTFSKSPKPSPHLPKPLPDHLFETHNPLQQVFEHYPRAVTMELRMLEELLGCRLKRVEVDTGRKAAPHIAFELL